jgi:hypothetical protein
MRAAKSDAEIQRRCNAADVGDGPVKATQGERSSFGAAARVFQRGTAIISAGCSPLEGYEQPETAAAAATAAATKGIRRWQVSFITRRLRRGR